MKIKTWLQVVVIATSVAIGVLSAQSAPPARSEPPRSQSLVPARPAGVAIPKTTKSKGRLFRAEDLGLLEEPDREQWQKPDQIMDALKIADGSVVADLGAAGGWFTIRLAKRVGPNGLVYAEDIQPLMLEVIERRVQRENQTNVKTVLGTANDPRLPAGLDAALIVDAYHEMDDPLKPDAIVTLLRNLAQSLKPQGRIGVVDFKAGGGGPGPAREERPNPESVIKAAEAAGLQLIDRHEANEFQFLLVFGRANSGVPIGDSNPRLSDGPP
ncbi:MAG TPA: class I SAM-dependent methyltransferase [Vicinamibacterales bacterium]|nr:class I SAM-dependent methyltransferase [Vicinamibacterales bacterium]